MDASVDSKVVMEMIRLLISYTDGKRLTTTSIHKRLYELKHRLPDSNPVKGHLPYYWFKAGAFSEYVQEGITELENRRIVEVEERKNYRLIKLRMAHKRLIEHDDAVESARQELQQIAKTTNRLSAEQDIRMQYEKYAPTQFYPKFRLDFMRGLEEHRKGFEGRDPDVANRLAKMLVEATASLPILPMLDRFKRAYFDFAYACERMLGRSGQGGKKYAELVTRANDTSVVVWNAFAYGARIIKHDKAYESRVPGWQAKFDEEVDKLILETGKFYLDVVRAVGAGDELEQPILSGEFVDYVLGYRKHKEIAYVKFSHVDKQTWVAPDHVKELPEYKTFMHEGHLDWNLMKKLSDQDLKSLMDCSMTDHPIFVSYSDKPKTVAYRMIRTATVARNTMVF